ncbi:hypothetical protein QGM71_02505 [Virgibacillus sp. C22-A2]|uniref:Uncharacterized protein n=1 Tax=Virgibacillus tibetensis TaxID=3042313 RepID=A0ABU6KAJ8_9BACI|nr:hypothetical protein [Virgibacillus sp. C22-A2]
MNAFSRNMLERHWQRYHEIINGQEALKEKRLVVLKRDLEQTYDIPVLALADEAFIRDNPEVMKLYADVTEHVVGVLIGRLD